MKYTIDAQGKKMGRVASDAAACLMGKKMTTFTRNNVADVKVEIINASKVDMTARKKEIDTRVTYTGYRGGLKTAKLSEIISKRGMKQVFHTAVYRMLPNNKLRDQRILNLTIKD